MEKPGLKPINDLVRRAMLQDGRAFSLLWQANIDSLKAYLRGWLKGLDDFYIDDICSRSFEKAFFQIDKTYDPRKSQFSTWLRTIARNTALDVLEQVQRTRTQYISIENAPQGQLVSIENMGDEGENPLDMVITTEDRSLTEKYVEGLPELYREVARKRLLEGCTYKEISDELNMELNTVRTRIRRAKALIDKMKEEE